MHFPAKRVSVIIERSTCCFGTLTATYTATGLDVSWPTFVQSISLLEVQYTYIHLSSLLAQLRNILTLESESTTPATRRVLKVCQITHQTKDSG